MSGGIDHLVITVRDLDKARALHERLGFTLTPPARHPFGTENSLAQFQDCFLELLAIPDPAVIPVPEPGAFSFARFNRRFLDRHEGISMLVLESDDAEADADAFAEAGLQSYQPFTFMRDAPQPDGSTARVGFELAFASDPWMPEAGFFTCRQLAPEHFWKPDYQRHANTAISIAEVAMIASEPLAHRAFFEGFAGDAEVVEVDDGLAVSTSRGDIRVLTPEAARRAWGEAVDAAAFASPRFAACTIEVADLDTTRGVIEAAGVPRAERDGRLIVGASDAMGVAIAFRPV